MSSGDVPLCPGLQQSWPLGLQKNAQQTLKLKNFKFSKVSDQGERHGWLPGGFWSGLAAARTASTEVQHLVQRLCVEAQLGDVRSSAVREEIEEIDIQKEYHNKLNYNS